MASLHSLYTEFDSGGLGDMSDSAGDLRCAICAGQGSAILRVNFAPESLKASGWMLASQSTVGLHVLCTCGSTTRHCRWEQCVVGVVKDGCVQCKECPGAQPSPLLQGCFLGLNVQVSKIQLSDAAIQRETGTKIPHLNVYLLLDIVKQELHAAYSEEMVFSVVLDVASDLPEDITCKCFFTMDAWDCCSFVHSVELGCAYSGNLHALPIKVLLAADVCAHCTGEACDIGDGPGLTKGLLKFDLPVRAPSKFMIEAAGVLEVARISHSSMCRPLTIALCLIPHAIPQVTAMYISFIYRGTEFHRTG
eukprot:526988-Amphidinium_carterae.2